MIKRTMEKTEIVESMIKILDRQNRSAIFLNNCLNITTLNLSASNCLENDEVIEIRDNQIHAINFDDDVLLQNALKSSLAHASSEVFFLGGANTVKPYRLEILSIESTNHIPAAGRPVLLVLLRTPDYTHNFLSNHFKEYFALTPSELKLCEAINQGLTLSEHARNRSIKVSTVRSNLKSIFKKTGVTLQTELRALTNVFSE